MTLQLLWAAMKIEETWALLNWFENTNLSTITVLLLLYHLK